MKETETPIAIVAAITHEGRVRPHNEDCIVVADWLESEPMRAVRVSRHALDRPLVCMVLDGMGGHAHGEIAARLAAQQLATGLPGCKSGSAVRECILSAHQMLFERMIEDQRYRGMGATLAGIRVAPEGAQVFNVGDSRVYRMQDGLLSQLSVDDVFLPPGWRGRSGLITQSLGGAMEKCEIEPHVYAQSPAARRTYLLCSDGLYDQLETEALEQAIDADPGASAQRLMKLALQAGARDNVSIVIVKIEPAGEPASS